MKEKYLYRPSVIVILAIIFIVFHITGCFKDEKKQKCLTFEEKENYWSVYLLEVNKKLVRFWKPPALGSLKSAVVYIKLAEKGTVLRHKVLRPSRSKYFEESFKRLIDFVLPLNPLPARVEQPEVLVNFYSSPVNESCNLQGVIACPYSCYKIPELIDVTRVQVVQKAIQKYSRASEKDLNDYVQYEMFQTGCASVVKFNCLYVTKTPVVKENTIYSLDAYQQETMNQLYAINSSVEAKLPRQVQYSLELINRGRDVLLTPEKLSNSEEYNLSVERAVKFVLPLNVKLKGFSVADIKFHLMIGAMKSNESLYAYEMLCSGNNIPAEKDLKTLLQDFIKNPPSAQQKFKSFEGCYYFFTDI